MPPFWVYLVGLVSFFAFWGTTGYFGYTSFNTGRTSTFVSLDSSAGECSEVAKAVSGSFLASVGNDLTSGIWSSRPDFRFNTTAYALLLQSYSGKQLGANELGFDQ